jgi:hypothetical protein
MGGDDEFNELIGEMEWVPCVDCKGFGYLDPEEQRVNEHDTNRGFRIFTPGLE